MDKARLRDNQYQLIGLLSIIESLYLVSAIIIAIYELKDEENPDQHFLTALNFSAYLWNTLSMLINIFICVDRWIAVKFCLRYHILVTKKKLLTITLFATLLDAFILSCIFYIGKVDNTLSSSKSVFTSRLIMGYAASLRTITCAVMLILGKKTIQYRDQSEVRIRNISNLHGTQAEELTALTVLRRGIKDVFKVNIWTSVFLLPMTLVLFMVVSGMEIPKVIFWINAMLISAYMISNPIVYLTYYTKLRDFWAPLFRFHAIVPIEP